MPVSPPSDIHKTDRKRDNLHPDYQSFWASREYEVQDGKGTGAFAL